ncbi:hypothetical protein ACSFB8_07635 [Enterococcus faecalis]
MKITIIEGTAQEVKKVLSTIGSSQEEKKAISISKAELVQIDINRIRRQKTLLTNCMSDFLHNYEQL